MLIVTEAELAHNHDASLPGGIFFSYFNFKETSILFYSFPSQFQIGVAK